MTKKDINNSYCIICYVADKIHELFEKHPLVLSIFVLGTVLTIFALIGFKEEELKVVAFFTSIILVIIYFDNRLQRVEIKLKIRKR